MRKLEKMMGMAAFALALAACGDTGTLPAPDSYGETGGGYGSGGNLLPSDGGTVLGADGGGTYGSGGKTQEEGGDTTVAGTETTATATCDERTGGGYGSGGRTEECALTEPTL